MSKRFPNRNRNAETPEELLMPPSQRNQAEEWEGHYVGILIVASIVVGIFALIAIVGWGWSLYCR